MTLFCACVLCVNSAISLSTQMGTGSPPNTFSVLSSAALMLSSGPAPRGRKRNAHHACHTPAAHLSRLVGPAFDSLVGLFCRLLRLKHGVWQAFQNLVVGPSWWIDLSTVMLIPKLYLPASSPWPAQRCLQSYPLHPGLPLSCLHTRPWKVWGIWLRGEIWSCACRSELLLLGSAYLLCAFPHLVGSLQEWVGICWRLQHGSLRLILQLGWSWSWWDHGGIHSPQQTCGGSSYFVQGSFWAQGIWCAVSSQVGLSWWAGSLLLGTERVTSL